MPRFIVAVLAGLLIACANVAQAVPISLFVDVDTYLERAKDVVIVKCVAVPERGREAFDDGLYPATVEIEAVIKGERRPGKLVVATIYPMTPGEAYLVANTGGSAFGTDFLALAELSVVPVPANFDRAALKDKSAKQQVQVILARHLYDVEQKLAPLLAAQAMLQKALHDRRDDVYESAGNVRVEEIREIKTTNERSMIGLKLPAGRLEWSHSAPGQSGYFYFKMPGDNTPEWEFAPVDDRDFKAFNGKPLKAKFYGAYSPGRDKRLGQSSGNAIQVEVGQFVLARTVAAPQTIYIIKIESQGQAEAMTARYVELPGPR